MNVFKVLIPNLTNWSLMSCVSHKFDICLIFYTISNLIYFCTFLPLQPNLSVFLRLEIMKEIGCPNSVYFPDHVILTGYQMINLVLNFEYLLLLCFLNKTQFWNLGHLQSSIIRLAELKRDNFEWIGLLSDLILMFTEKKIKTNIQNSTLHSLFNALSKWHIRFEIMKEIWIKRTCALWCGMVTLLLFFRRLLPFAGLENLL